MAKQKTGSIGIERHELERVREVAARAGLVIGRGAYVEMGSTDKLLETIAAMDAVQVAQLVGLLKSVKSSADKRDG